jgi:predicted secreted protein with PEFG-CTERM motif
MQQTFLQDLVAIAVFATIRMSSMSVALTHGYAYAQDEEPTPVPFETEYRVVDGYFEDKELGFGLTLPDSMKGFVYEYDSFDGIKSLTLQVHPEFNSTESSCCPAIETTPAALLLDSGSLNAVTSPVPFTGDLYAAIQGYNMRMSIEDLNNTQVLVTTLDSERNDLPGYDTLKRVGKFYFMNSDERYISYGLWASEENYQKYLDEFEESAKSLVIQNAKPVNLQSVFSHHLLSDMEVKLKDGSVLQPEIITPSIIESVGIDEDTNTIRINITEPSGNSFLIMNSGELLAGPHSFSIDGEPIEIATLSNENGEYLIAYYDDIGEHEVAITGTAVVPEFGVIAIFIATVSMIGVVLAARRIVIR